MGGGGGGGGGGGVITSCGVRWIESCGNLEDVASLKMLLRCKYRCCLQKGGGGGVITSCGARWIESCGNLEDVSSLKMLLRCKYRCCLQKGGGGMEGCNNVMWSALDWELWEPWGCCFVEDVVTLQKTNGALAPSNCFKKPLWTWRWKRCDVHFVHGSPVNYDIF